MKSGKHEEAIMHGDHRWYGFDKLDGSLIRAEWSPKKGLYKFGRKNALLDHTNPVLLEAPEIILGDFEVLDEKFREEKFKHVVAFFEFLGENSFAGSHKIEEHRCTLIDLAVNKRGLVDPEDFLHITKYIENVVPLVWEGQVTERLLSDIRDGSFKGITSEGAVFKRNNRSRRWMFKAKSSAWYRDLKEKCNGDRTLYKELQ